MSCFDQYPLLDVQRRRCMSDLTSEASTETIYNHVSNSIPSTMSCFSVPSNDRFDCLSHPSQPLLYFSAYCVRSCEFSFGVLDW